MLISTFFLLTDASTDCNDCCCFSPHFLSIIVISFFFLPRCDCRVFLFFSKVCFLFNSHFLSLCLPLEPSILYPVLSLRFASEEMFFVCVTSEIDKNVQLTVFLGFLSSILLSCEAPEDFARIWESVWGGGGERVKNSKHEWANICETERRRWDVSMCTAWDLVWQTVDNLHANPSLSVFPDHSFVSRFAQKFLQLFTSFFPSLFIVVSQNYLYECLCVWLTGISSRFLWTIITFISDWHAFVIPHLDPNSSFTISFLCFCAPNPTHSNKIYEKRGSIMRMRHESLCSRNTHQTFLSLSLSFGMTVIIIHCSFLCCCCTAHQFCSSFSSHACKC